MVRHITGIILALAVIAIVWVGCSRMSDDIVASVGDWTITTAQFKDEAMKKLRTKENAARASQKDLEKILDDLVVRKLKTIDAYSKGFDTAPDIVKAYEDELKKGAIFQLYINEIRNKIVSEDMVRDYYNHDEELNASHILIKTGEGISEKEAKKKIDKIYREAIKPGADFAVLSDKYNEDSSVKGSHGDLGWFGWGKMVDQFQDVAFAMKPGEISKPFKTDYGWHIIKMQGRRKIENRPPLEDMEEEIRNNLARMNSDKVEKAADDFIKNEKEKLGVVYFDKNIASLKTVMENNKGAEDLFAMLTRDQQILPLATVNNGADTVTAETFKDKLKRLGRSKQEFNWDEIGKKLVDDALLMNYILPQAARKLGYYDHEDVVEKAKATRDRKTLYAAQTEIVNKNAEPTDEQVREYYDKHTDKFMTDPRYTIHEVLVSDKDLATEIRKRAENGESLQDMAMKYSERKNAKKTKGVLGPFKKTQHGVIGKEASRAEIGQIVGPITHGKKWSVFKLVAKEEPVPEKFEKVKRKVEAAVRRDLREKLEKQWVDGLRKSISNRVNYRPLATLFDAERAELNVEQKN